MIYSANRYSNKINSDAARPVPLLLWSYRRDEHGIYSLHHYQSFVWWINLYSQISILYAGLVVADFEEKPELIGLRSNSIEARTVEI